MSKTLLVTSRADFQCKNCKTIKTHTLRMYFDDDNQQIYLEKQCKCYKGTAPYVEAWTVPLKAVWHGDD